MKRSNFKDRLAVIIGTESVRGFAKRLGRSEGTIRGFLQGREPKLADVVLMAEISGYNFLWIATGQGSQRGDAPTTECKTTEMNNITDALKCPVCESDNVTVWLALGVELIGSVECGKCGSKVPLDVALEKNKQA